MLRCFAANCFAVFIGISIFTSIASASEMVEASWYGRNYHGRPTASGEIFDSKAFTAAHPSLPLGIVVEVRRVDDGRAVRVKVNDRCGRCGIDLSKAAGAQLGLLRDGRALVRIETPRYLARAD
ncbi:MAG: septal ring lytic transglycosylase RlpA family protein [Magnetospirillum gryphiswaldense]|nr:septal ring lytic transglycosylase RlpA family protein [Magnetospirillum gryphiswaldense]